MADPRNGGRISGMADPRNGGPSEWRAVPLSLTYKVFTTTQPPYLHNLIFTQRPRSTRSSSIVTIARPPSSSSLKIIDRSFRYASPCLYMESTPYISLSTSFWYQYLYFRLTYIPSPITSSSDSPLSSPITPSPFRFRLTTYLFHKSYPQQFHFFLPDYLHGLLPEPCLFAITFSFFSFSLFFHSVPCATLSWPSRHLLSARKSIVSYHIAETRSQCDGLFTNGSDRHTTIRLLHLDSLK